jgi:hypothetical protein
MLVVVVVVFFITTTTTFVTDAGPVILTGPTE